MDDHEIHLSAIRFKGGKTMKSIPDEVAKRAADYVMRRDVSAFTKELKGFETDNWDDLKRLMLATTVKLMKRDIEEYNQYLT